MYFMKYITSSEISALVVCRKKSFIENHEEADI